MMMVFINEKEPRFYLTDWRQIISGLETPTLVWGIRFLVMISSQPTLHPWSYKSVLCCSSVVEPHVTPSLTYFWRNGVYEELGWSSALWNIFIFSYLFHYCIWMKINWNLLGQIIHEHINRRNIWRFSLVIQNPPMPLIPSYMQCSNTRTPKSTGKYQFQNSEGLKNTNAQRNWQELLSRELRKENFSSS